MWHKLIPVGEFSLCKQFSCPFHWLYKVIGKISICKDEGRQREMEGKPSADSHVFEDRELEKHITPQTLKPKIKQNPLFSHISVADIEESKSKPSWTIQDYDRHTAHGQLADYMKVLH
ncbi:hypothetical protein QQF64_032636 [Cirrhinus molitorella]|uniref:Major intrinsically disordered Notch2-binding receptor 1-like C-terminal domain-containing protein n=1 Tax=Cirrhinus molitorella TaxID=172907 RepID=A0ABR3N0D1_9TELE